jgi:glycogen synthase
MAYGLLAVASNVSDIPDVLIDGETGFIVDEEQPDSVFQVLRMAWEKYEESYFRRKTPAIRS